MPNTSTDDQRPTTVAQSGMFIRVEVDEPTASDAECAAQLAGVCPVDIFAAEGGHVAIVEKNLDECILCGLCLAVGAPGSVRVVKLYDDGALLTV
jgi:NAD-dependent dihydropyrimidine dehydrogenase PreA subunit